MEAKKLSNFANINNLSLKFLNCGNESIKQGIGGKKFWAK